MAHLFVIHRGERHILEKYHDERYKEIILWLTWDLSIILESSTEVVCKDSMFPTAFKLSYSCCYKAKVLH